MSDTVDFLNLLLVIAIKCNLSQFCNIGRYYNHYYKKFTEVIKLKCGYDLDYIVKYVSCIFVCSFANNNFFQYK